MNRISLTPLILIALFSISHIGHAAKVTIAPTLGLTEQYTDNLFLDTPESADSELITQINPALRVAGEGRRASVSADYRMQNLFYRDHDEFNGERHQFGSRVGIIVVPQAFRFNADANFTQRAISSTGRTDPENITPTDNLTDVVSYSLSPSIEHEFADSALASLRYQIGRVRYLETTLSGNNALNQTIDFDVRRAGTPARVDWSISYHRREADYDENTVTDTLLERTTVEARLRATNKTVLIAQIGYEANEFQRASSETRQKDTTWGLGMSWTPTMRTQLEFVTGGREFGHSSTLSFRHRARRSSYALSYDEDYTTSSFLEQGTLAFDDEGSPIFDLSTPTLSTEVFLTKRLLGTISKTFKRSTLSVSLFGSQRESQRLLTKEDRIGASAEYRYPLGRRTILALNLRRQETQYDPSAREDTDTHGTLRLTRRLQRQINGEILYSYLERDSNIGPDSYERNLAAIKLTATF